jgi:hypothetical protein
MKSLRIFPAVVSLLGIVISIPLTAYATNNLPTSGAMPDVVYLRKNCETLQNCATTMEEIVPWISNTRIPTATKRLTVDIGPGQFGTFSCTNGGYTTLRGAGRTNTTIGGPNAFNAIAVSNCTDLDFESLKVTKKTGTFNTIVWQGGGKSTWSDVDVIGSSYAWVDMDGSGSATTCTPQGRSVHYWFNSRIVTSTDVGLTKGYVSQCSESWFFGSEITANVTSGSLAFALGVHNNLSEAHVYGSVIRIVAAPGVVSGMTAAFATNGAKLHIHGTGIDAIGYGASPVTALSASNNAEVHADVSAYNLSTGEGGTVTRIAKDASPDAHIHAPYQWQHIPGFPLVSVTGADVTTETVGADINMLVYNSQCTGSGGPWYNVALRACR